MLLLFVVVLIFFVLFCFKGCSNSYEFKRFSFGNFDLLTGLENLILESNRDFSGFNISESFLSTLPTSLRRLKLSDCNLGDLNANSLCRFAHLTTLHLEMCSNYDQLRFQVLPRLEWLFITANLNYPSLCQHFFEENLSKFKYDKLVVMDIIYGENWTFDRDWLSGFPGLKFLRLHKRNLKQNEEYIFPDVSVLNTKSLEKLALRTGSIKRLEEFCTQPLVNLKHLDLSRNRIDMTIPDVFAGFDNLIRLDIRSNDIGSIHPDAFRGLVSLEILDLSDNKIKWDENRSLFVHMRCLKTLNICCSNLSDLEMQDEGFFTGLDCLEELKLSGNSLTRMSVGVLGRLSSLKRLYLSENKFQDLPPDVLAYATRLEQVYLKYNRFTSEKVDEFKKRFLNMEF